MKKWRDIFNFEVSRDYKNRVLVQATKELVQLRTTSAPWYFRWQFVTSLAGAMAFVIYIKNQFATLRQDDLDFAVTADPDMFDNLDLFEDMELIESLNEQTGDLDS